jgi:hypothetical protein
MGHWIHSCMSAMAEEGGKAHLSEYLATDRNVGGSNLGAY